MRWQTEAGGLFHSLATEKAWLPNFRFVQIRANSPRVDDRSPQDLEARAWRNHRWHVWWRGSRMDVIHAVADRGCWMPGANEDLGYPRKYFSFIPKNFWWPFYSHSQHFFTFSHQLSHFTKISSLYAPSAASCPVTTFFSSFLAFTYNSFTKTDPGWMPGSLAPSAPPLHATGYMRREIWMWYRHGCQCSSFSVDVMWPVGPRSFIRRAVCRVEDKDCSVAVRQLINWYFNNQIISQACSKYWGSLAQVTLNESTENGNRKED